MINVLVLEILPYVLLFSNDKVEQSRELSPSASKCADYMLIDSAGRLNVEPIARFSDQILDRLSSELSS